jgi:cell division protein FtsQ
MRPLNATALPTARPRWHRRPPRWLRTSFRYGALALLLAVLGGGGLRLWQSGAAARAATAALERAIQGSAALGLTVGEVMVEGRNETQPAALATALGIRRGEPLLAVDLGAVKARLEALPWVLSASVERRWPQLIYVKLAERSPLALWQQDGKIRLIDSAGTVIEGADTGRFGNLPFVVGEGAGKAAPAFLAILAQQPSLAKHVQAAVRVGRRRWNLHLVEGIDVRLPESNPEDALGRLAELETKERLFDRDIVMIDLRLPDRLIVRLSPEAAQQQQLQQQQRRERKPGKNT